MQFNFESSTALKIPSDDELEALDSERSIIAFTNGRFDDGKTYYAYVAVRPSMYREFHAKTKLRQPFVVGDYGSIIMCGEELHPPADVAKMMRDEYGFDDAYEEQLLKEVTEQRNVFCQKKEEDRLSDIVNMLKKQQN